MGGLACIDREHVLGRRNQRERMAPLGDFFGTACGYIPYASLPLGDAEQWLDVLLLVYAFCHSGADRDWQRWKCFEKCGCGDHPRSAGKADWQPRTISREMGIAAFM